MTGVKILVVDAGGGEHELEGAPGQSVMELCVSNNIDGIDAECGGACSCATCHVYVEPDVFSVVGEPSALEAEMLDFARAERQTTSRLSCQVKLAPQLTGARFTVAGG